MSDQPPIDAEAVFRRLMEAGREIKLGAGVVAKSTRAMLGLLAIWGVVVLRFNENWIQDVALMVGGFVASSLFIWWVRATMSFAERNPAQAMLDGAQFIEYKKFEAEIKGGADPATLNLQGEVKPAGLLE